jgi:hypothetical protein
VSAQQLARVGLALLGTYLIVQALASGADSFSGRPFMVRPGGDEIPEIVNSSLVSLGMAFVGVLLYGVLPGTILIAKSGAWAKAWFPEAPAFTEIPLTALVSVGLLLLGINFGVEGLAGVIGGVVRILTSEDWTHWTLAYAFGSVAASVVSLVAGVGLFLLGKRSIGAST